MVEWLEEVARVLSFKAYGEMNPASSNLSKSKAKSSKN